MIEVQTLRPGVRVIRPVGDTPPEQFRTEAQQHRAHRRQRRFPVARRTTSGPGTELMALLKSLGIHKQPGCDCKSKAKQMDAWGVDGCRAHRDEIADWLRSNQEKLGWREWLAAGVKAVAVGLAFSIDWRDPFGGLVDESIRRVGGDGPP
jgi:hypothetical protein